VISFLGISFGIFFQSHKQLGPGIGLLEVHCFFWFRIACYWYWHAFWV